MRVLLLFGGFNEEREVSINSASGVRNALKSKGHEVIDFDFTSDNIDKLFAHLKLKSVDVIFNALHGIYGEDGQIQAVCNYFKIPYTYSGFFASALAMNKVASTRIFKDEGLPTIKHILLTKKDFSKVKIPFDFPFVVKPINSGSSYGVHIIHDIEDIQAGIDEWQENELYICQPFIHGREIHVAVLDDTALGTIEIKPSREFFDYQAKYTKGTTQFTVPAQLDETLTHKVCSLAIKAHHVLGCRGLSRVDFLYNEMGFHILELNTQPGLTENSLVPRIAKYSGLSYEDLIDSILSKAAYDKITHLESSREVAA